MGFLTTPIQGVFYVLKGKKIPAFVLSERREIFLRLFANVYLRSTHLAQGAFSIVGFYA